MANWWIAEGGINYLTGTHTDPTNPVKLPDEYLIDFLRNIPQARQDLNLAYPDLLPAEKDRILELIALHPFLKFLRPDPQNVEDDFQHRLNTQGIYTTGPSGGKRFGN